MSALTLVSRALVAARRTRKRANIAIIAERHTPGVAVACTAIGYEPSPARTPWPYAPCILSGVCACTAGGRGYNARKCDDYGGLVDTGQWVGLGHLCPDVGHQLVRNVTR